MARLRRPWSVAKWVGALALLLFLAAPGCSKDEATTARAYVDALALGPDGPVDFNIPEPAETSEVEWIIAHGKTTTPLLVEALSSPIPRKVGYAAYCLGRMNAPEGRLAAEAFLRGYREPYTHDKEFAWQAVMRYLFKIQPKSRPATASFFRSTALTQIKVGDREESILNKLGAPHEIGWNNDNRFYTYPGVEISVDQRSGEVTSIEVRAGSSPASQTAPSSRR